MEIAKRAAQWTAPTGYTGTKTDGPAARRGTRRGLAAVQVPRLSPGGVRQTLSLFVLR